MHLIVKNTFRKAFFMAKCTFVKVFFVSLHPIKV